MIKEALLIIIVLILGLGITLITFSQTHLNFNIEQLEYPTNYIIICFDSRNQNAGGNDVYKYGVDAGFPLNKQWVHNTAEGNNFYNNSCNNYPYGFGQVFSAWQFYIDWMIWSLLVLVVFMIIKPSHAHLRH